MLETKPQKGRILNSFYLDLLLSFFVGGAWVTLASLTAQSFGGKIGGFVAGLPATSVLAIFFITYTEGAQHGYDLTGVFPLTISVNAIFLAAYALFSRKRFLTGLGASLGVWVFAQALLFYLHPNRFSLVLALGAVVFVASFALANRLRIPDPGTQHVRHGVREIFIRAVSGGAIVVLAMVGSRYGGPVMGGILSAFPATVVATLIITAGYGGRRLTRAMATPMMVSGVINCMVFALVYRHVVLNMHILGALATAYGVTMASALCTFYLMNRFYRTPTHAIHT